MASPAAPMENRAPRPPDADPTSIRRCLSPRLLADFDAEWELVLERAKESKSLEGIHQLLLTWRGIAYAELRDPGAHYRLLAKAEHILATGEHPGAVPLDDLQALIGERLGR